VDNLPLELVGKFAELAQSPAQEYSKVALGLDVRSLYKGKSSVEEFLQILELYPHEILFMDCREDTLVRRFKASRRLHPLAKSGRIEDGIRQEREYLRKLKDWSDYVVDTSDMLTRQLQEEMSRLFDTDAQEGDMFITIMSFGYKYGIPSDADLVFDVRFLPNPFYVEELKHKTGNDKEVRDYVCQTGEADEFLRRVEELLDYLIPKYKAEGKRQLMVCVGCTGGRHRSVTMANKLADYYEQQPLAACLLHRDIATA
jgi:UPF0042 nucleotide-binding protein